jgi:light-regulated signal transduction histidine kinase (bacteriophytochrome)
MSGLISDLLSYSRTTFDGDREVVQVDLEQVLRDTLTTLRVRIEDTETVVTHDRLPVVTGDAVQLGQVFQNLLSNAMKYRRPDRPPRIYISVGRRSAEWIISVADNGQGFAPEFSERIFGIFKRLHGREVPGTGIGLAICKAVVVRHGGRIWAEGRPGEGATFRFTLPLSEDTA